MSKEKKEKKSTRKKHHKETFDRIPEEKRRKILDVAISEFARCGFISANINEISKKAGISVGAMYKYFASKEDLLLAVLDIGYDMISRTLEAVESSKGDIFEKLETLFRAAQQYSRQYKELTQVYLDVTSEGLSYLSKRLSKKMESISARFYKRLLKEAIEKKEINSDIDEHVTAFCLDNLVLLLQFSYTAEYYRERMKIFAGDDALTSDEKIIKGIMKFVRGALSQS